MTDNEPTSAETWRESGTPLIELPSGKKARIRKLNLFALLEEGMLPVLQKAEQVRDMVKGLENKSLILQMSTNPDLREFIEALLIQGVISPKLTSKSRTDAAPDEVPLEAIDTMDVLVLIEEIGKLSDMAATASFFQKRSRSSSSEQSTEQPKDTVTGPVS